jgi:hypothetical protein
VPTPGQRQLRCSWPATLGNGLRRHLDSTRSPKPSANGLRSIRSPAKQSPAYKNNAKPRPQLAPNSRPSKARFSLDESNMRLSASSTPKASLPRVAVEAKLLAFIATLSKKAHAIYHLAGTRGDCTAIFCIQA